MAKYTAYSAMQIRLFTYFILTFKSERYKQTTVKTNLLEFKCCMYGGMIDRTQKWFQLDLEY